jgi:tetratricopeptide (TPR) repeat protein
MKFHVMPLAILIIVMLMIPLAAADTPDVNSAGALYTKSVDLANDGKYQEALDAADQALAMNVTSLTGLIQSNRAGILVMLHRDDDAITAADAALAIEGNLTTVHSIAWYNKGNALRALGRIAEAQDAYNHAYALDNTLVPPDMSADVTVASVSTTPELTPSPFPTSLLSPTANPPLLPTQKSPLSALVVLGALGVISGTVSIFRKK